MLKFASTEPSVQFSSVAHLSLSKYVTYDGQSWWFKGNVKDLAGVGRFVIGLADQMDVIDSPALVNYLKKFAERNLRF